MTQAPLSFFVFAFFLLFFSPKVVQATGNFELPQEIADARIKGTTLVVTSTADSGPGSLREALEIANDEAFEKGVVITFSSRLNGETIVLENGELVLEAFGPLEISAAGLEDGVTIDAGGQSRVITMNGVTDLFHLENLTLTGGKPADGTGVGLRGGGILNKASLSMVDCKVIGNFAGDSTSFAPSGSGGGIYNSGSLKMWRCLIAENQSGGGPMTTSNGDGGGIANDESGLVQAWDSTIERNSTPDGDETGQGAGIYNGFEGETFLWRCSVLENVCGTTTSLISSAIPGDGGGIYNEDDSERAELVNCTVAYNVATETGGGLRGVGGFFRLINCTIAENTAAVEGGGIRVNGGATAEAHNCLVINNSAPVFPNANLLGGSNVETDHSLGALDFYGGVTKIMPLIPGVSDAGSFSSGDREFVPRLDQRGFRRMPTRSAAANLSNDIGAVEVSSDTAFMTRLMIEAGAQVFTVTNDRDSGPGSLREAVTMANAAAGTQGAVVLFSSRMNGRTITLTSGEILAENVQPGFIVIWGASLPRDSTQPVDLANGVTISGNDSSRIFNSTADNFRLRNLTITNGFRDGSVNTDGGGILIDGGIDLDRCVVKDSAIRKDGGLGQGGGVFVGLNGSAAFWKSEISGNSVGDDTIFEGDGGGAYIVSSFSCYETTFHSNTTGEVGGSGGGLLIFFDDATISASSFHGNSAADSGGGMSISAGTTALIKNTTVANNSANIGGGIDAQIGTAELLHCTVTANTASTSSGGIAATAASGDISNRSIIAHNTAASTPNAEAAFLATGFNTDSNNATTAPIGDYGGPTFSAPPLPGSFAEDRLGSVIGSFFDQMGEPRTAPAEMGAVELTPSRLRHIQRAMGAPAPMSPTESDTGEIDPEAAGSFSGILTDPATGRPSGTMTIRMTDTGALSVSVNDTSLGVRGSFRGMLDATGQLNDIIAIRGDDYDIAIRLVETVSGTFRLVGTIARVGEPAFTIGVDRNIFDKRTNPTGLAGRYTALFPKNATVPDSPDGDGYGLVTAGADGRIKLAGALGDGAKLTLTGFLSAELEWRIFKALYRTNPKGSIGGLVKFEEEAGISDFSGVLAWTKNPDTREKLHPDGFDIAEQSVIGSKFTTPVRGTALIPDIPVDVENNAVWEAGQGNVAAPGEKILNWDSRNRAKATNLESGEKLSISASTKTGLVRGTYSKRSPRQKIKFAGVAFQKQSVISGLFPGKKETGFFKIESRGTPSFTVSRAENDFTSAVAENDTISFGSVGVDRGSIARERFIIANTGTAALHIDNISITGSTGFEVLNGTGKTVPPGKESVFTLVYDAPAVEAANGVVTIQSSTLPDFTFNWQGNGISGSGDSSTIDLGNWSAGVLPFFRSVELSAFSLNSGTFDPAIHGGTFVGIVRAPDGAREILGAASISVNSRNGSLSGSLGINGARQTFRGNFDTDGVFNGTTNRGTAVSLEIQRNPGAGGGEFKIAGNLGTGETIEALQSQFHARNNPADDFAGAYTSILPGDNIRRNENEPQGDGYGTVSIGLDGRVRSALVLGDGTKASYSSIISKNNGEWYVYINLYRTKPKGYLAGRIQIRDVAGVSDFDGELAWVKPPSSKEKRYPLGFSLTQWVLGSAYAPPAPGTRAFSTADASGGNLVVKLLGGDTLLRSEFFHPLEINWGTNNRITYTQTAREKFSFRFKAATGLITGTYNDASRKIKVPVGAVVFQKQDIVSGTYLGENRTGSIEFKPPL